MSPNIRSIIAAGVASAALFFTVLALGLGFFFFFLPTLPLFYVGLKAGSRVSLHASLVASLLVCVITGAVAVGVMFYLLLGLPCWFVVLNALSHRTTADGSEIFYPLGRIWLRLALAACCLMAFITAYYATQEQNLPAMLTAHIEAAFVNFSGEYAKAIEALSNNSFLIMAVMVWLWGIGLYVHLWLANMLLLKQGQALRPSMAVLPFAMPSWMFSLITICALASLIGGQSMAFLGKTLLLCLAMPYFFLGLAHVHEASQQWPNRKFLLFLLYFVVVAQLWPTLLLAGWGFWQHLKIINKHLPSDRA